MANNVQPNRSGPDLKALGLNSPMEVIDILGALKVDGRPVIIDDKAFLNPQMKAEQVIRFFSENFNTKPNDLPHLAAEIKKDVKAGKIDWGRR